MLQSKRLIYNRTTKTSADTGTNNLRTDPVEPDRIHHYIIISVENKTSPYTTLRIGAYNDGVFHPCFEEISPGAGELIFSADKITLREGMQLQAELKGCTAGDHLEMYISGYWEEENAA